jgi:hypothetical protein
VKKTAQSYRASVWTSAEVLQSHPYGSALLTRFLKTSSSFPSSPPFYDPAYNEIDRIIDQRTGEYLVKWMDLGYEDATWETDVPAEAITAFEARKHFLYPSADGGSPLPLPLQVFDSYAFNDTALRECQLAALNLLIFDYSRGDSTELFDEFNMKLYLSCCAFIHFLLTELGELGPFLIVTPLSDALDWYDLLRETPNATAAAFFGTKEGRAVALETDLCVRDGTVPFHVVVTTPEIFANDADFFRGIRWRLIVYDEVRGLKQAHSKMARLVADVTRSSHIVLNRGTPRGSDVKRLLSLMLSGDASPLLPPDLVESARAALPAVPPEKEPRRRSPADSLAPPYVSYFVDCPLNGVQRQVLRDTIAGCGPWLRAGDFAHVCRLILRVCTHPFLLHGLEYELGGVDPVAASTKLAVAAALLEDGGRVLVV